MTALPVVTDPGLAGAPGVRHAFFTRHGGVSTGLYASLNVGIGSNDDADAVLENRRRARAHLGGASLVTAYQIHSAEVVIADGPWPGERPHADAVVTRTPGVVCAVLSADCAPVLLADAQAGVVAAAHAGWRGALGGVVQATVARMGELGARPERIVAAVGPCIGPTSYEVGQDFLTAFERNAAGAARFFVPGATDDKRLFDLPGFVLDSLTQAGVQRAAWVGRDTCAEATDFYSNRRALLQGEPDYGRLLSAIVLT